MTKKEIISLVVAGVVVIGIIVLGVVGKLGGTEGSITTPGETTGETTGNETGEEETYTPEIPQDAVLTPPEHEAPATSNPASEAKARFFTLAVSKNGFSPEVITVKRGDTVYIDFQASDGNYDLSIPYLGVNFPVVKQGETRRIPFDVSVSGIFVFQCNTSCPLGKTISGSLIVLP